MCVTISCDLLIHLWLNLLVLTHSVFLYFANFDFAAKYVIFFFILSMVA